MADEESNQVIQLPVSQSPARQCDDTNHLSTKSQSFGESAEVARPAKRIKLSGAILKSRSTHDVNPHHQPSPFKNLAAELRNQIYELVLQDDQDGTVILEDITADRLRLVPHSLARTCRKIRREFVPMEQARTWSKRQQSRRHIINVDNFELRGPDSGRPGLDNFTPVDKYDPGPTLSINIHLSKGPSLARLKCNFTGLIGQVRSIGLSSKEENRVTCHIRKVGEMTDLAAMREIIQVSRSRNVGTNSRKSVAIVLDELENQLLDRKAAETSCVVHGLQC